MKPAGAVSVAGLYFLYFASVGITLPFLPAFLRELGLPASQIGLLLAVSPLISLVAPQGWGWWADRTGRPDLALRIAMLGAPLAFSALLAAQRFESAAAVLIVYAAFSSAIVPLLDTVALERVQLVGGSFARLRMFGSLGFALSAAGFGWLAPETPRAIVWAAGAFMFCYAAWSWSVRSARPRSLQPPAPAMGLLRDGALRWLLAATALHWMACTPSNGIFALHVADAGMPRWVVGVSASGGVLAELGMFAAYPALAQRASAPRLLAVAAGASALRWAVLAWTREPLTVVTVSLLHAFTFGMFYASSVAFVAERVPTAQRATGQALFNAVTFGLGGLLGYTASGVGYQLLGGQRLFLLAAAMELLAVQLALRAGNSNRAGVTLAA